MGFNPFKAVKKAVKKVAKAGKKIIKSPKTQQLCDLSRIENDIRNKHTKLHIYLRTTNIPTLLVSFFMKSIFSNLGSPYLQVFR